VPRSGVRRPARPAWHFQSSFTAFGVRLSCGLPGVVEAAPRDQPRALPRVDSGRAEAVAGVGEASPATAPSHFYTVDGQFPAAEFQFLLNSGRPATESRFGTVDFDGARVRRPMRAAGGTGLGYRSHGNGRQLRLERGGGLCALSICRAGCSSEWTRARRLARLKWKSNPMATALVGKALGDSLAVRFVVEVPPCDPKRTAVGYRRRTRLASCSRRGKPR